MPIVKEYNNCYLGDVHNNLSRVWSANLFLLISVYFYAANSYFAVYT